MLYLTITLLAIQLQQLSGSTFDELKNNKPTNSIHIYRWVYNL